MPLDRGSPFGRSGIFLGAALRGRRLRTFGRTVWAVFLVVWYLSQLIRIMSRFLEICTGGYGRIATVGRTAGTGRIADIKTRGCRRGFRPARALRKVKHTSVFRAGGPCARPFCAGPSPRQPTEQRLRSPFYFGPMPVV